MKIQNILKSLKIEMYFLWKCKKIEDRNSI